MFQEAKKRGAAVWLVDTYETPTARIADQVVLVRPGSDGALALGLMHSWSGKNWIRPRVYRQACPGFCRIENKYLPSYPPPKVVMSLYVYHSNPAIVAPDQNKVLQGLLREDLFTIVHERFLTDTARYADIVLPATTSLEHPDIYSSYGHYGIQRASAVIPPLAQAKSNWEVFQLLAQAMGFEESFFYQTADELIDQIINLQSPLLRHADLEKLHKGQPVELHLPDGLQNDLSYPFRQNEILNPAEAEPLPRYRESHGDEAP
jgi:anaerobic selenocysteine-containing dehydrogenase